MKNNNLEREVKLILDIVKDRVENKETFSGKREYLNKINRALFKQIISCHEITPLVYISFKNTPDILPKEIMEFLKNEYYGFFLKNLYYQEEFLKLNQIFVKKNLTLVPIKGLAFLFDLYRQMPIRPMVDMDVLVKEEELEKAMHLLIKAGYKQYQKWGSYSYWRNKNCNIPFKKIEGDWDLELHFALDIKRSDRYILPDLWTRLRTLDVDGNKITLLSPEDNFFSLVLHHRRYGNPLSLKGIFDGALILNDYATDFDWDYILRESRENKMCSAVFFFLTQLRLLLNVDIPQGIWRSFNVPAWKRKLINCLIKKETFYDSFEPRTRIIYLKSHFLLYDSLWEPIKFIINIPQEQFAKFYGFEPYERKAHLLYIIRPVYIMYKQLYRLIDKRS